MVGKNKRKRNNKKNQLKKANELQDEQNTDIGDVEEIDDNVVDEQRPTKRPIDEDDSDAEDKPRKKKKKQPIVSESGDKKGKKSIRQLKREKHLERQAAKEAVSKDQLKSECINYLSQWKHDKPKWKFMKIKQVWLSKNKFSETLVPETSWPTLLEYFDSAQGNIRNTLLEDANKVIKQMDDWTESQKSSKPEKTEDEKEEQEGDDTAKEPEILKPDDVAYKRARDLIQCLH